VTERDVYAENIGEGSRKTIRSLKRFRYRYRYRESKE
jgi:hypothetical protein